jgi:hypothetical protein
MKSWFSERTNKIYKPLSRLRKKKKIKDSTKIRDETNLVAHTCNLNNWEAKTGGLEVQH